MKDVDEVWTIECVGCMTTSKHRNREVAASELLRHRHGDDSYRMVKVTRSGHRQLELLLGRAGTVEVGR